MSDGQVMKIARSVSRLRAELGVKQSEVAQKAEVDQSRLSRIEKGEVVAPDEVQRVLRALAGLGSADAEGFIKYMEREWTHIEAPSFWNPERSALEIAEETLQKISRFLNDEEQPWPLRRQLEKRKEDLLRASTFLTRLKHNIAFIGDLGVGKSTAISFVFDLLAPAKTDGGKITRTILATGAGRTTICEVHIKDGPEFGLTVFPMSDADLTALISDFCASKWEGVHRGEQQESAERAQVSAEIDRAIRNMSGLTRKRTTIDGKPVYSDPVVDLVRECSDEEEFRARIVGAMNLAARTTTEIWYESGTREHPAVWLRETFSAVNGGRLGDVPLPKSISLTVPGFGKAFGEFEITVIDTKGVEDVAVREDLDLRLKDPRTTVVLCCGFREAPGTTAKALLQHMKQTFAERFDTGKVSVLALPRGGEALEVNDDLGEAVQTVEEGYEFRRMQVASDLAVNGMEGLPIHFFNMEVDNPKRTREDLFGQLAMMREAMADHLFELCHAADEIIENHEKHAVTAAIEEVARQLNTFLLGNRNLGAREQHAYEEALKTVRGVRYASTLWASARRSGEYYGLNLVHQIGVGAAKDARRRSSVWFASIESFINALKADENLSLAKHSIDQIGASAKASRRAFVEGAQRIAMEIYREPLTQDAVWSACASEWGQGPGFKHRVAAHLEEWFEETRPDLKETLDRRMAALWERSVVLPLMQLTEENAPDASSTPDNIVEVVAPAVSA